MNQADLLELSDHKIESRATMAVIAFKCVAGREATDTCSARDALVDFESVDDATGEKRLIGIMAFGGVGRGNS